jgi:hypothetical protein
MKMKFTQNLYDRLSREDGEETGANGTETCQIRDKPVAECLKCGYKWTPRNLNLSTEKIPSCPRRQCQSGQTKWIKMPENVVKRNNLGSSAAQGGVTTVTTHIDA